ncbi:hypothetical protein KUCAC02_020446 [Chaenocephalus aceratus]|nr:hypothetical protein KUCAC02_020446 [Chaenocephalus aceratus]
MSLTAAASGLVVFLLSGSVVQGQDGWGVTYSSPEVCAVKGSTVEMSCSFTFPSRWKDGENTLQNTFWFTEKKGDEYEDLTTVSKYAGRVEYLYSNHTCTLRIRNLTERDAAEYYFRFITNQDAYWGLPGTTLSVTGYSDLQVECLSSCPPGHTSYIWFKNGQEVKEDTSPYADFRYGSADSYSCALKGLEDFPSPCSKLSHVLRCEKRFLLRGLWTFARGPWKLPAAVTILLFLLAVTSLSVFLWIRRKRASGDSPEPEERADTREEPEQQEDLQYASVSLLQQPGGPSLLHMRAARPLGHTEQQEVPEYAAIKFSSAAPRTRGQDSGEDPAAFYSTVNKSH